MKAVGDEIYFHGGGVMVFDSFVGAVMVMCLGGCEGEGGMRRDGGTWDRIG